MAYILTHMQDWLTFGGPPLSIIEWVVLLVLLSAATVIFNIATNTSDPLRMIGNFLSLAAGAGLGGGLFPDLLPSVDLMVSFTLALFAGMTATALIVVALFRPA